jgi:hypothetical protein
MQDLHNAMLILRLAWEPTSAELRDSTGLQPGFLLRLVNCDETGDKLAEGRETLVNSISLTVVTLSWRAGWAACG